MDFTRIYLQLRNGEKHKVMLLAVVYVYIRVCYLPCVIKKKSVRNATVTPEGKLDTSYHCHILWLREKEKKAILCTFLLYKTKLAGVKTSTLADKVG